MDSASPQAVAVGSLLPPALSCKGLSASNSAVVGVSSVVGRTGSALFLPVAEDHPSAFCGPSGNVVERVLPEGHHAVKFVAVYDNGTNSHAVRSDECDSCQAR